MVGKQMTNLENVAERVGTAEGFARKIWLFGIGIYSKGVEEIQRKFDAINDVKACLLAKVVFNDEETTADTEESVNKNVLENIKEQTAVDKRVADVRIKLGLDTSNTDTKIAELSQKINALTEIVGKLS
jgi:hypothetical protein